MISLDEIHCLPRDGWIQERELAMKITAPDLMKLKIVDRIVDEPAGGAHSDREAAIGMVGDALEDELNQLSGLTPDQLRAQRAERFYAIGRDF